MSYSVCFIGNSHLAAIAQAWRKHCAGAREDVSLVFFGSRAGSVRQMNVQNGVLVPSVADAVESFRHTSGGKGEIVVADYDAFVLYGLMGFRLEFVLPMFAEYGTADDRKWGPPKHLVSEDCLHTMLRTMMAQQSAFAILEQIRALSSAPVLICPMPYRPVATFQKLGLSSHPRISDPEFLARVVDRCVAAACANCAEHGGHFLPQDETTVAVPGFTKPEFSLDGSDWKGKNATEKHMNERYGGITLGRILSRLDALLNDGRLDVVAGRQQTRAAAE